MAGKLTTYGAHVALDALTMSTVSIHTADPTDTGAVAEVSGGSYARQNIVFGAAASRGRNSDTNPSFEIPGGTTVSHFAIWDGANCVVTGTLSSSETFTADGRLEFTDADVLLP